MALQIARLRNAYQARSGQLHDPGLRYSSWTRNLVVVPLVRGLVSGALGFATFLVAAVAGASFSISLVLAAVAVVLGGILSFLWFTRASRGPL